MKSSGSNILSLWEDISFWYNVYCFFVMSYCSLICFILLWKTLDKHLYNCFYFLLQKLINYKVHYKEKEFDTSFFKIESAQSQMRSFLYSSFIKEGIFLKFIMNFKHMIILAYNFFSILCMLWTAGGLIHITVS